MAALSRFEKMEAEAFQSAADKLEEELVRQGVWRAIAAEFIEKEVTLLRMPPGLKIVPKAGELFSLGHSDACLVDFARQLHLRHEAELGGTPVRGYKRPERDSAIEHREKVKVAQEKGAAFRQQMEEIRSDVEQDHARKSAVDHKTRVSTFL